MGVFLVANRSRFVCAMTLVFVLSSILTLSVAALSSREVAVSSVSEAEQSIVRAYVTVLDAERVGGNVSGLLVRLNDAAGLISNASTALEVGNFDEAVSLAALSSQVGSEVRIEAERLQVEANSANATRSLWYMGGSVLGVSAVAGFSFLGYRYLKRAYYRRLLKMKPRVGQE